jgi:MFS transporter, NRE family, putaive nickel resistance protein
VSSAFAPFNSLHNPAFARLYLSQTTSLLGDALTWVGLALLAFELAGSNSSVILGAALTLRVTAFVILSPLAGALADRLDRKAILVISDLGRMVVIGLMPFVTQAWQVYVLMFALNALTAFFTPTYQATIPLVTGKEDYGQAISRSRHCGWSGRADRGTFDLLLGRGDVFDLRRVDPDAAPKFERRTESSRDLERHDLARRS